VVLYGCETWSLTLREECRLRVLRILGPKRDEETGRWRKLHNEELHNLYSSPSIIRMIKSMRMRWAGRITWMGENAYRILVGKPDGKRPLGRPRGKWVENIWIDLTETGWYGMDWIDLAQDKDKWSALMNFRLLSNAKTFLSSYTIGSFSRRAQLREFTQHS
jgi:hypothetical protein